MPLDAAMFPALVVQLVVVESERFDLFACEAISVF